MRASDERILNGACVEVHTVSSSVLGSQRASTPRGSIGTPASRCCCTVTVTRWAASRNARSASPWRHAMAMARLSRLTSTAWGAPAESAVSGSATPSSGS